MAPIEQNGRSRSLAIYRALLELYPTDYLQQLRAEMLQNFEDFERNSSSKSALWLFIAKDLAVSLKSHFIRSLWGQTIVVLIILDIVLAIARRHPGEHEHSIWLFCCGYLLGWFAGWLGKHWQTRSISLVPHFVRSLWGQSLVVVIILAVVLAVVRQHPGRHEHFIWAFCYGYLLAWFAGWLGKRRQARP